MLQMRQLLELAVYYGNDLVFLHCVAHLIDYNGEDVVWSRHSLAV